MEYLSKQRYDEISAELKHLINEVYPKVKDGGVDYAGMLQDLLQETDTADGLRLDPPCFTVSRILTQVPLGAGFREVVLHLGVDLVDQVLQLGCNLVVSLL